MTLGERRIGRMDRMGWIFTGEDFFTNYDCSVNNNNGLGKFLYVHLTDSDSSLRRKRKKNNKLEMKLKDFCGAR